VFVGAPLLVPAGRGRRLRLAREILSSRKAAAETTTAHLNEENAAV